ncbi:MAG: hypothetical protein LQ344_003518 [Seirophora lacunosa]|nr:MAG: hypothetical protein LQ344_003518 [Seirophora lacunosa]
MRSFAFSLLTIFFLLSSIGSCGVQGNGGPEQQCDIRNPHCNALAPAHRSLSPRQPFPVPDIWRRQVERTGLVLLSIGSGIAIYAGLRELHQRIIGSLLERWAQVSGRNQVVVEYGSLRWEFGCTKTPIPERFLLEYFKSKRDAVARGFMPMYEKEWLFNSTNRRTYCYVGMRVGEEGRPVVPPTQDDIDNVFTGLDQGRAEDRVAPSRTVLIPTSE